MDKDKLKKWKRVEVFFEFFVFGVIVGIIEDIICITVITDEKITWSVVGIVVLIAIPFAALGELLVDKIDFVKIFTKDKIKVPPAQESEE